MRSLKVRVAFAGVIALASMVLPTASSASTLDPATEVSFLVPIEQPMCEAARMAADDPELPCLAELSITLPFASTGGTRDQQPAKLSMTPRDAASADASAPGCFKFNEEDRWCWHAWVPGPSYACGTQWYYGEFSWSLRDLSGRLWREVQEVWGTSGVMCQSLAIDGVSCYAGSTIGYAIEQQSCRKWNTTSWDPIAEARNYFRVTFLFNGFPFGFSHGMRIDINKWGDMEFWYF